VNPKVAALVVALLVVLFVVGVGAGVTGDDGDSRDDSALVDAIASAAGDTAAVDRADILAGCTDEDDPDLLVVPGGLGASCTVVVRSDDQLRLARFVALDPVSVRAPAPEGDVTVEADPDPSDEDQGAFSVAVGEGDTEVLFLCSGTSCRVRVVTG
jgi:hypothetical protein